MTDAQLDALVDEVYPIRRPAGWRRSFRGNLTRPCGARWLTVFRRFGAWRWSITGGDGARYSTAGYSTEAEAADAVTAAAREG